MKSIRVFAFAVALLAMLSSGLLAAGNGNVDIKLNIPGVNQDKMVLCGVSNRVDVWIQNDAPLYEISLGLRFVCNSEYSFQPFGTLPAGNPIMSVEGDAQNAFDVSLDVDISQLPDEIYIHGVASQNPLPVHAVLTKVFSFRVIIPQGIDNPAGFCVDNIVNPTTGEWSFDDGAVYAPNYNGFINSSITIPDVPAKCFETVTLPLIVSQFTSTPPDIVSVGHCDEYSFDVNAVDMNLPPATFWFSCSVGTIDSVTGVYVLPSANQADTVNEVIALHEVGYCGIADEHAFTIIRQNAAPTIATCKPIMRVQMGTSREIHHQITDPDACDSHSWSVELASGTPPVFPVSAPSLGIVEVDASAVFDTATFEYRLGALDASGLADTCMSQLKIVAFKPGDANDDGLISISDVVYIIPWIFGAGEIPEPFRSRMDADGNGYPSISDAVYLINYIFIGGPEPC